MQFSSRGLILKRSVIVSVHRREAKWIRLSVQPVSKGRRDRSRSVATLGVLIVFGSFVILPTGGGASTAVAPPRTAIEGEIAVCQPTVIGSTPSIQVTPAFAVLTLTAGRIKVDSVMTKSVAGFTFFVLPGRYVLEFQVSGKGAQATRVVNVRAGTTVVERFGSFTCAR